MSGYRLGVHDDDAAGGVTLWYDFDDPEDAYTAWRLLRDYRRDGVNVTVQLRGADGAWRTVEPLAMTRPHDWAHDQ